MIQAHAEDDLPEGGIRGEPPRACTGRGLRRVLQRLGAGHVLGFEDGVHGGAQEGDALRPAGEQAHELGARQHLGHGGILPEPLGQGLAIGQGLLQALGLIACHRPGWQHLEVAKAAPDGCIGEPLEGLGHESPGQAQGQEAGDHHHKGEGRAATLAQQVPKGEAGQDHGRSSPMSLPSMSRKTTWARAMTEGSWLATRKVTPRSVVELLQSSALPLGHGA